MMAPSPTSLPIEEDGVGSEKNGAKPYFLFVIVVKALIG